MQTQHLRAAFVTLEGLLPTGGGLLTLRGGSPDFHLIEVAGDAEGTLSYRREELLATPGLWVLTIHPEDRDEVMEILSDLDEGEEETLSYRVLSPGRGGRWMRECVRRVSHGGRSLVLGIVVDVTEARRARARAGALKNRMVRTQRIDSLGSLASGIAHDFNNLLTTILSTVQLLEEGYELDPEARGDLRMIRDAAERGSGMVRQILEFASRDRFDPDELDAGAAVRGLEPILDRTLGADIDLRIRVGDDLPRLFCDRAQLEQVVLNMAVNAREAMPDGGRLEIGVESVELEEQRTADGQVLRPGDYVVISVSDTGDGMPEGVRSRIFEPFFTTKSQRKGSSGFGLSTVQRIARGYGGGITVSSEVGEGSTFRIFLPVREAPAHDVPEVGTPAEKPNEGLRIMVVEDEPTVRRVLTRQLTRAGHEVVSVGTAKTALQVFDKTRPRFDLVLVDVILPDRSGPDLVGRLLRRAPQLAVVFASGYGREVLENRGGAVDRQVFLRKPFSRDELLDAVARALREVEPDRGAGGVERAEGA